MDVIPLQSYFLFKGKTEFQGEKACETMLKVFSKLSI